MLCVRLEAKALTSLLSGYFWLHRKEQIRDAFLSGFAFQGDLDTYLPKYADA